MGLGFVAFGALLVISALLLRYWLLLVFPAIAFAVGGLLILSGAQGSDDRRKRDG